MYTKTCEGCGELFEAVKRNKKWCTDLCGRRTRRRGAALGGRAACPIPVVNPVVPS